MEHALDHQLGFAVGLCGCVSALSVIGIFSPCHRQSPMS
jgi:hypothetical protein